MSKKMPSYLYHYTTIKSLPYIFKENKKVALQLTDFRFLNDAEEGFFLEKYIRKNREVFCQNLCSPELKNLFNEYADFIANKIERLLEKKCEVYLLSFTELDDSMQFWRQDYAKDKGICLKLKTSSFKVPNKLEGSVYDYNKKPVLSKVKYIGINNRMSKAFPKLKKSLEESLQVIRKEEVPLDERFFHLPKVFKHFDVKNRVWRSEKEWRMKIIRLDDKENSTVGCLIVNFKVDECGIPRAKIEMDNPFEEIILGPSFTAPYADTIRKWLHDRGFKGIKVRCGDGILNT